MFRPDNDMLEPTWPAHGDRLHDTNLGLAERLSPELLYCLLFECISYVYIRVSYWLDALSNNGDHVFIAGSRKNHVSTIY
jgi:hypothetical protein